jgi:hypothetical protein
LIFFYLEKVVGIKRKSTLKKAKNMAPPQRRKITLAGCSLDDVKKVKK